ncbi:MAG: helix-turn-helix domain-containing protein [Pseudomonadota bacterium]
METGIELLDESQVAVALKISKAKLQSDRFYRRGIPYVKIGRRRLYRRADVEVYLEQHRIDPADREGNQ